MPAALRYGPVRRVIGIHVVYRSAGGGLIVGGLSYAALFALIPTIVLVVAGIFLLIDDPEFRRDAIDLIGSAFPAFEGIAAEAISGAREFAAVGGVIALVGFAWGASGLYVNLTRAMERFFPGERVSGGLARVLGVLLVVLVIVAVMAAVLVAGVLTVVARALALDAEWLLTAAGAVATLLIAGLLAYGIYRLMPADPPTAASARPPAILVGLAVGGLTLLYGVISPWLVSGFEVFGVMASVFVALVWLRLVFLAVTYGAALARYRDYETAAVELGEHEPDAFATAHAMAEEQRRATHDAEAARELELGRAAIESRSRQGRPGASAGDASGEDH